MIFNSCFISSFLTEGIFWASYLYFTGQLFSPTGGNAPVAAGGGLIPKRMGFHDNKDSAAQAAGSGLFPKRLGIQVNEISAAQAAGHGPFPKGTAIQLPGGYMLLML